MPNTQFESIASRYESKQYKHCGGSSSWTQLLPLWILRCLKTLVSMIIVSAVACKPPFNTWKQHLQVISLVTAPLNYTGGMLKRLTGLEARKSSGFSYVCWRILWIFCPILSWPRTGIAVSTFEVSPQYKQVSCSNVIMRGQQAVFWTPSKKPPSFKACLSTAQYAQYSVRINCLQIRVQAVQALWWEFFLNATLAFVDLEVP